MYDFDSPQAIDMKLFTSVLHDIKKCRAVQLPVSGDKLLNHFSTSKELLFRYSLASSTIYISLRCEGRHR